MTRLNPSARRALMCHIVVALALAIADTFLSVYIFRLGDGYRHVAEFLIWRSFLTPLGFALSAWLARRTSTAAAYRVGIIAYNLFFLGVMLLGQNSLTWLPLLGFVMGIATGLYWLGWQVLILDLTNDAQRDTFFSLNNLGGGLVCMVGGPLAGWFLSELPGVTGYRWIFAAASLLFFIAIWISRPLHSPSLCKASGLRRLWKVTRQPPWQRVISTSFLSGTRDGALIFIMGVLVYQASGSESELGHYTALVSLLALCGATLAGRHIRPATRDRSFLIGATSITLGIALLACHVSPLTLCISGGFTALMSPFFNVPYASAMMKIMNVNRRLMSRRADSLILREIAVSAGRMLGSAAILFVTDLGTPILRLILLTVACVPLVIYVMMRPMLRDNSETTNHPTLLANSCNPDPTRVPIT